MFGTMKCIYETPCHWCSKWDKKCNEKIGCNTDNDPVNMDVDVSKLLKKTTNEDILFGKGLKKI